MSRLANKQCPFYKSECLIGNCAMYDERLDNCLTSIVTFNMYKVANAIANATPEALQTQPTQPRYPGMR